MKTFAVIVLCIVLQGLGHAQFLTGPITNPSNGHRYYLSVDTNWNAAEALGVGIGGHLATINDATENNWVVGTFSNFGGQPRVLWIGLNDVAQEGVFQWVSGEPVTYLNWAPPEPNDGAGVYPTEEHVHIWNPDSGWPLGSWNDAQEFLLYNGVIEVIPEPSTLALFQVGALFAMARWRAGRPAANKH